MPPTTQQPAVTCQPGCCFAKAKPLGKNRTAGTPIPRGFSSQTATFLEQGAVMHLTQQHPDLGPQNKARCVIGMRWVLVSSAHPPAPAGDVRLTFNPSVPLDAGEQARSAGSQPIKNSVPYSLTAADRWHTALAFSHPKCCATHRTGTASTPLHPDAFP